MCEVMMPDGVTPHPTNARATILDDPGAWFGFEQEYFLYKDGRPLGFPGERLIPPRKARIIPASAIRTSAIIAREIVEKHLDICLDAGINHEGINAEVAKGQWEFQIFGKGSKKAADEMWVARYILQRLGEKYGVDIELPLQAARKRPTGTAPACTPISPPTTCAKSAARNTSKQLMAAFDKYKNEHIAVYGPDNHMRLTGLHETQSIDKFNYGVADRGASIRVPHSFVNNGYKGYLEDRRPNSQGDPYQIASRILKTIATVPTAVSSAPPLKVASN